MADGYKNITTKTTTLVATGLHRLHAVRINTAGSADVVKVYDGTDATGYLICTITAAPVGADLDYDVPVTTGICVVTSGTTAGDYTITFD